MLHTSLAGRSRRKFVSCSRGMNCSVPATTPVAVMPDRPACWKLLARPKSVSLAAVIVGVGEEDVLGLDVAVDEALLVREAEPLEGLLGRGAWPRPARSGFCRAQERRARGCRPRSTPSRSRRCRPASRARTASPCCGWRRLPVTSISRWKTSRACASTAASGRMSFKATVAPSDEARGQVDDAHAAAPEQRPHARSRRPSSGAPSWRSPRARREARGRDGSRTTGRRRGHAVDAHVDDGGPDADEVAVPQVDLGPGLLRRPPPG